MGSHLSPEQLSMQCAGACIRQAGDKVLCLNEISDRHVRRALRIALEVDHSLQWQKA